jgi:hypothetical protein
MELKSQGFVYLVFRHVFCRFGLPRTIYADQDGQWFSDFWAAILSYLKTRMVLSSARHPQHDGQTEIVNQRLEIMIRAYVSEDLSSWAQWLPYLEFAYNSAQHSSTGYTPYQLLYGFSPKGPLDLTNPRSQGMRLIQQNDEKVQDFLSQLESHRDMARQSVVQAQEKQAHAYDVGRRPRGFDEGDLVLVNPHTLQWRKSKGTSAKLRQQWIFPFKVAEKVSENAYRLRLPASFPGSNVLNLEHLRPYSPSPKWLGLRATLPDTRTRLEEGEQHDIESLLAHRYDRRRKTVVYLAHFRGYSSLADKWLSARDLRDAPELLRAYRARQDL